jgi:membrane protein implicated in regulation of membrane protease activity
MMISSRGTIIMGPLGWMILGPFLLLIWLAVAALIVGVWAVAALVTFVARPRAVRRRERPALPSARWPYIPPGG